MHRDDREASHLRSEALERELAEVRARAERAERAIREAEGAARRAAAGLATSPDGRQLLPRHGGGGAPAHPALAKLAVEASERLGPVRSAELFGDPTAVSSRRARQDRTTMLVGPLAIGALPGGLLGAIVGRVAIDLAAVRGPLGGLVLGVTGLALAIAGALLARQFLLRTGLAPRATVLCTDGVADWLLAPGPVDGALPPARFVRFDEIARARRTRWAGRRRRGAREPVHHLFRLELVDHDGRTRFDVTGIDLPPGASADPERFAPWVLARLLEEEMSRRNAPRS